MKKFLALALAVICIFSMATVAFAGLDYSWECEFCGGTTTSYDALQEHIKANNCGRCQYCEKGFETADLLAAHEKECPKGSAHCDYCGKDFSPISAYDAHLEACKAKYFNIPLAKIIETVKNLLAKIDFEAVFATVKDLGGKLVGALGNIGK